MADVACKRTVLAPRLETIVFRVELTSRLLLAVASHGTDDGVLLAAETVHGALGVALGLGGLILGLALGVLLLAGLGPGGGAGEVTDRLDDGAFERVVLPGGLAVGRCPCQRLLAASIRIGLPGLVGVRGVGHCEGRG